MLSNCFLTVLRIRKRYTEGAPASGATISSNFQSTFLLAFGKPMRILSFFGTVVTVTFLTGNDNFALGGLSVNINLPLLPPPLSPPISTVASLATSPPVACSPPSNGLISDVISPILQSPNGQPSCIPAPLPTTSLPSLLQLTGTSVKPNATVANIATSVIPPPPGPILPGPPLVPPIQISTLLAPLDNLTTAAMPLVAPVTNLNPLPLAVSVLQNLIPTTIPPAAAPVSLFGATTILPVQAPPPIVLATPSPLLPTLSLAPIFAINSILPATTTGQQTPGQLNALSIPGVTAVMPTILQNPTPLVPPITTMAGLVPQTLPPIPPSLAPQVNLNAAVGILGPAVPPLTNTVMTTIALPPVQVPPAIAPVVTPIAATVAPIITPANSFVSQAPTLLSVPPRLTSIVPALVTQVLQAAVSPALQSLGVNPLTSQNSILPPIQQLLTSLSPAIAPAQQLATSAAAAIATIAQSVVNTVPTPMLDPIINPTIPQAAILSPIINAATSAVPMVGPAVSAADPLVGRSTVVLPIITVAPVAAPAVTAFVTVAPALSALASIAIPVISEVDTLAPVAPAIAQPISAVPPLVAPVISALAPVVSEAVSAALPVVENAVTAVLPALSSAVPDIATGAIAAVSAVVPAAQNVFSQAPSLLTVDTPLPQVVQVVQSLAPLSNTLNISQPPILAPIVDAAVTALSVTLPEVQSLAPPQPIAAVAPAVLQAMTLPPSILAPVVSAVDSVVQDLVTALPVVVTALEPVSQDLQLITPLSILDSVTANVKLVIDASLPGLINITQPPVLAPILEAAASAASPLLPPIVQDIVSQTPLPAIESVVDAVSLPPQILPTGSIVSELAPIVRDVVTAVQDSATVMQSIVQDLATPLSILDPVSAELNLVVDTLVSPGPVFGSAVSALSPVINAIPSPVLPAAINSVLTQVDQILTSVPSVESLTQPAVELLASPDPLQNIIKSIDQIAISPPSILQQTLIPLLTPITDALASGAPAIDSASPILESAVQPIRVLIETVTPVLIDQIPDILTPIEQVLTSPSLDLSAITPAIGVVEKAIPSVAPVLAPESFTVAPLIQQLTPPPLLSSLLNPVEQIPSASPFPILALLPTLASTDGLMPPSLTLLLPIGNTLEATVLRSLTSSAPTTAVSQPDSNLGDITSISSSSADHTASSENSSTNLEPALEPIPASTTSSVGVKQTTQSTRLLNQNASPASESIVPVAMSSGSIPAQSGTAQTTENPMKENSESFSSQNSPNPTWSSLEQTLKTLSTRAAEKSTLQDDRQFLTSPSLLSSATVSLPVQQSVSLSDLDLSSAKSGLLLIQDPSTPTLPKQNITVTSTSSPMWSSTRRADTPALTPTVEETKSGRTDIATMLRSIPNLAPEAITSGSSATLSPSMIPIFLSDATKLDLATNPDSPVTNAAPVELTSSSVTIPISATSSSKSLSTSMSTFLPPQDVTSRLRVSSDFTTPRTVMTSKTNLQTGAVTSSTQPTDAMITNYISVATAATKNKITTASSENAVVASLQSSSSTWSLSPATALGINTESGMAIPSITTDDAIDNYKSTSSSPYLATQSFWTSRVQQNHDTLQKTTVATLYRATTILDDGNPAINKAAGKVTNLKTLSTPVQPSLASIAGGETLSGTMSPSLTPSRTGGTSMGTLARQAEEGGLTVVNSESYTNSHAVTQHRPLNNSNNPLQLPDNEDSGQRTKQYQASLVKDWSGPTAGEESPISSTRTPQTSSVYAMKQTTTLQTLTTVLTKEAATQTIPSPEATPTPADSLLFKTRTWASSEAPTDTPYTEKRRGLETSIRITADNAINAAITESSRRSEKTLSTQDYAIPKNIPSPSVSITTVRLVDKAVGESSQPELSTNVLSAEHTVSTDNSSSFISVSPNTVRTAVEKTDTIRQLISLSAATGGRVDNFRTSNAVTGQTNANLEHVTGPTFISSASAQAPASTKRTTGSTSDPCSQLEWGPWIGECNATCGDDLTKSRRRKVPDDNYYAGCKAEDTASCNLMKCSKMTKVEQLVASISVNVGSIWVMVALTASIGVAFLRRSSNYLPVVHVNEDISLLMANLLEYFLASRNDNKYNQHVCKWAAIGLQYCFLVTYSLQMLEALHIYSILMNVCLGNNVLIGLKKAIALCWGAPIVITAITAASSYDHLIADFSCWINFGDNVFLASFLPCLGLSAATVILLEAAGGSHDAQSGKTARNDNVTSCIIARAGLAVVFGLQFASWFMGALAVYADVISYFAILFGLNIATGVCIYIFHFSANERVRATARSVYRRIKATMGPR